MEQERYQRVKDTEEWKSVRADYIAKLKQQQADNPALQAAARAYAAETTRRSTAKLMQDPEKRAALLAAKRELDRKRRATRTPSA